MRLRRVAQLRQRVGDGARQPEIKKSKQAKKNPDDRHHPVAGVTHVMQIERDGHERDDHPRHWREKIDNKIDF